MLASIDARSRRRSPAAAVALSLALGTGLCAQRPDDPLPPATRVRGAEIAALDAATINVDWEEARVADLPRLSRLTRLRRLQINPRNEDGGGWPKVTPDELVPLAALPALEILTIPYCAHLSEEHLQRLAGCEHLTSLTCINEAFTLDAGIAGAFAAFPALRSLELSLIRVTAEGLAALAGIEGLERLELTHCRDLDAAGMAAVAGLRRLRSLELAGVGRPDMIAAMQVGGAPDTWALDVPTMQRLAALPELRELALLECRMAPHLLAELSPRLTSVKLWGYQVDAAALRDLRQLPALRALDLHPTGSTVEQRRGVAAAAADLLGGVHLERLRWYGAVTKEVRSAIAGQADLCELALPLVDDLEFVALLPKLEHLELWPRLPPLDGEPSDPRHPTAEDLAPLRQGKALRRVTYRDSTLDAATTAALQRALGPEVTLLLR